MGDNTGPDKMLRVWLLRRVAAREGTSWMVCRRQIPTGNLWVCRVIAVLYISPLVDNNHSVCVYNMVIASWSHICDIEI